MNRHHGHVAGRAFAMAILSGIYGCSTPSSAGFTGSLETPTDDRTISLLQRTTIPIGYYEWCEMNAAECAADRQRRPRTLIDMSKPENRAALADVNNTVNGELTAMDDIDQYGIPELWTLPRSGKGDCEDYAMLKRKRLVARGMQDSSFSMLVLGHSKTDPQYHAVLAAWTTQGVIILDMHRPPYALNERERPIVKIQDPGLPYDWYTVVNPGYAKPTVTATMTPN